MKITKLKLSSLLLGAAMSSFVLAGDMKSGVDLKAIDRSVRPQDDFYAFANGTWLKETEIPAIYSSYSTFTQVYEDTERALKALIDEAATGKNAPGSEAQKIGDFYASWLDLQQIESRGLHTLDPELKQINQIKDKKSLFRAFEWFDAHGLSSPIGFYVTPDLKDSTQYMLYVSQSGLSLPNRDYYLKEDNENFKKIRSQLPGFIEKMLTFSGDKRLTARAQAVYDIEHALAEIQWSSVENRDSEKRYNPHNKKQLRAHVLPWASMETITKVDRLNINQPSYFEALDKVIDRFSMEDWQAYMLFQVMDGRSGHLPKEIDDASFEFHGKTVSGSKEQRPRWKRGVSMVNSGLGEALGKLYVKQYFPAEAKRRMKTMVQNVIDTFDKDIDTLSWMSKETQDAARKKLLSFSSKIGYPEIWRDYSSLDIKKGDHLGNWRRIAAFNHKRQLNKLGKPIDKNEWFMTPQTVNAYYSPTANEIVFPAARLQPPLFQLDADDAINYGAVGAVIGHEISHGFDDQGSKFDGDGNMKNWWTEEDRKAFEAKAALLVEQYGEFEPLPGMKLNGELTLGENIGDLSGLVMAYRAYITSLNGKDAPVIDGFTGPQRFFLGYAMARRGKRTEKAMMARLVSAPHSPLKYRVNGVIRNMPEFYQAFGVKEGDQHWLPANKRVKIW